MADSQQTTAPDNQPTPVRPRTIYLLCPAGLRTGGPEAIHQLGGELVAQGHDARIVYLGHDACKTVYKHTGMLVCNRVVLGDVKDKMPEAYGIYGTRDGLYIDDTPDNVLIFPEALPFLYRIGTRMQKHLWWLSVDNAMHLLDDMGGMDAIRTLPITHLCQSAYAEDFLLRHGISRSYRLFDYTRPTFLDSRPDQGRADRVLYNPRKGQEFVERLMAQAPDIDWVPIIGMDPEEVHALLLTSKVYIDFGAHPGKDRIPREAAISGCCVITGRQGAANFFQDVPIDDAYKFDENSCGLDDIVTRIRDCFADFSHHSAAFAHYRRCIRTERDEFSLQVRRLYG